MTATSGVRTVPASGAVKNAQPGTLVRPAGSTPARTEFTPPAPSRTPQLFRRLQAVAALALLVLGGVGTLLVSQLRTDLESAPQVAAQYARLGEVQTRLTTAGTLATEGVILGGGSTTSEAAEAAGLVGEATGILVEAAEARPQDTDALSSLGRQVTAYGVALQAADAKDAKTARARLGQADEQLDKTVIPALRELRSTLEAEASASNSGWLFVMPVLGIAAAAFLVWTSWVVAQRTRRVLNLGLVGAVVGVIVISWVTLAAQQGTAQAVSASRVTQVGTVVRLNEASSQLDTARRLQTEAILTRSWTADQAKAFTAAVTAAKAATDPGRPEAALAAYSDASRSLAALMAKGDWAGAAQVLGKHADDGAGYAAAEFQQAISDARSTATTAAAAVADEVRNGLPWQLAAIILTALVGAGLAVAGMAQRLVEYR